MKSPSTNSLQGMRLLITRVENRSRTLVDAIISAGGLPIVVPTIDIVDPEDIQPLITVFHQLNDFDIAIFVSPNAVTKTLLQWQLYRAKFHLDNLSLNVIFMRHLKVLAIGSGTKERLTHYSITVNAMPVKNFSTEGLLELPILQKVSGKRIVIFCGLGGRAELANTLQQRGACVTSAYTYCRRCPNVDLQDQLNDWQRKGIDIVVGTSAESLYNLLTMVEISGAAWLKQLQWLVVSQRMADLTKALGFVISPIIADNATNEAIFQALINRKRCNRPLTTFSLC
jgi:uroporphyrinogen-III synthase